MSTLRSFSVRLIPVPGEAIDSYLERFADANHVTPAALLDRLRDVGGSVTFLVHAPSPQTLAAIAGLCGQPEDLLQRSCLSRYAGLAYDLDGIDPDEEVSRRAATYRVAAAKGWLPARASQVCPSCLAEDAVWRLSWRLPGATVCVPHGVYLVALCPECGRPFRSQRHSPLRAVGAAPVCGNPIGQGPRRHCEADLTTLPSVPAEEGCRCRQLRFEAALDGGEVSSWAGALSARTYLAESRALTVLLLHLASQPHASTRVDWADDLQRETDARTRQRGPRWGIAPPADPRLRSRALTAAEAVIDTAGMEEAVAAFRPWYDLTPESPEGRLGWLADRTRMTPLLTRLVMAAHAPRRRLSARLDHDGALLPLTAIPQAVPPELYRQHLSGLLPRVGEEVGRAFAALAIARTHPETATWEDAALALRLAAAHGPATARAVHARLTVSPEQLHDAITAVAAAMDPTINWRCRERYVRRRATTVTEWLPRWAAQHRSGTQVRSAACVITWQWIHHAGGLLATSPAWPAPPSRRQRAAYRQFTMAGAPDPVVEAGDSR